MNRNGLIGLVIVALLVLVGIIFFWSAGTNTTDTDNITQPDSDDVVQNENSPDETPATWERYESSEFDFALYHQPAAEVSIEGPEDNYVKFAYIGPDSEMDTEITDGYTFTVGTVDMPANQSLEVFAEAQLEESLQIAELVEGIEQVSFGTEVAYTYTTENLGTVTHYVLEHPNGEQAFVISYNVSDPNENGYLAEIERMLNTFRFTSIDGSAQGDTLPTYTSVEIALLDRERETDGEERGCDLVVMTDRNVAATTMPLTAALEELFAIQDTDVSGYHNFIARTNDTLSFDYALVENGTAYIYLSGEVSGFAGVCDNPRPMIQIEETAEQFTTVNDVRIFLNGTETDLQPNMRG